MIQRRSRHRPCERVNQAPPGGVRRRTMLNVIFSAERNNDSSWNILVNVRFVGLKGSRAADRSNSARVDGRPLTYPRRGTLPGLFAAWNFQFKLEFRAVSLASAKATESLLLALAGTTLPSLVDIAVPKITDLRERYPLPARVTRHSYVD